MVIKVDAIAKIDNIAQGDDSAAEEISLLDLQNAGVTDATLGNLGAYRAAISSADNDALNTEASIKTMVDDVNDAFASVTISGTATQGQTLTAGVHDVDVVTGAITYQWKRGSTDIGTDSEYVLLQGDVGSTITVNAQYTDGKSTSKNLTSAATGVVINANDSGLVDISLTGAVLAVGREITATVRDDDGLPGEITYTWRSLCCALARASGSDASYLLRQSDVGYSMEVTATYTDTYGNVESPSITTGGTVIALPTMNITAVDANDDAVTSGMVTTDQSIKVTFTSSEATTDFSEDDITVDNGSLTSFTSQGSDATYTATFTATSDGETTLQVPDSQFTGGATGNGNIASDLFSWTSTYNAYSEVIEDIAGNVGGQAATDIQINSLEGVSGARVGIDYTTRFNESSYVDRTVPTVAEIRAVVDYVNLLVDIGNEADNSGTDRDFTTGELTTALGLNDVTVDNVSKYNSYIDANADLFSAIATPAEVQSMVHIVNVIAAAAEPSSLTSQHLVLAGVVVNAGTDPVNTLSVAELAQVSFDINAANPVTTAALQGIAEQVVTPVISLTGNATVTIEAGGNYTEQGAIASDAHDVDTSPTVTVGGDSVDASSVGSYTVTYNVTDASGNVASQVTRTVTVVDTTAPVLTMIAGTDTVERGGAWTDAGATTTEGIITTSGTVDTAVVGTYTITYSATDASNNTTTGTRTVNVVDTTAPVITVTAGTDTIERGGAWTDAGATTTEGIITTSGTVDTAVVGTYTITYSATDASDLTTTATRTVNVVDTTAPVITVTAGTDTLSVVVLGQMRERQQPKGLLPPPVRLIPMLWEPTPLPTQQQMHQTLPPLRLEQSTLLIPLHL